ncbi:hypothetical protein [Nocardioides panaciterrulae]|uniref:Glycosyl hydrolase family 12 n=1 Tax=Nocardioides panaciterrulae TaxID=661492 RepID=A0A7Y9JBR4_9ACTN|nr:hypothetical protein [Nocardioides panaciterrulae]
MKRLSVVLALVAGLLLPLGAADTATAAACTHPEYVTSSPDGMWGNRGYWVHNDMWNASSYHVSQTLSACSFRNWKVTATADNSSGDGAVKTYPNVHKDFHNWSTGHEPRLRSFSHISSTWAARTPHVGVYDAAYDIWLNGVPGEHEVMIWTENFHQVPSGSGASHVATRRFGGHRWKVWATDDNGYIAFVPAHRLTHGKLALKKMLDWLVARGHLPHDVTLGAIDFGFEIVSTGGSPARFKVNDFSLTTRR